MIGLVLALTAAAESAGKTPEVAMRAATVTLFLEYQDCVRDKTTVAGGFNSVDARKIARSAEPGCAAEWQAFRSTMFSGVEPSAADLQSLESYRSLAIGSAASDLVVTRAGSCGTMPGPYACRHE
jgi:hypothetical protein